MIHSLFVKIDGVGRAPGIGARGLCIVDEAAGTRVCGDAADMGDEVLEDGMFAKLLVSLYHVDTTTLEHEQLSITGIRAMMKRG